MCMLEIFAGDDSLSFRVKVAPRASRSSVNGVHAGALKVSLTAPPVEGAANAALGELLAKLLAIPRRDVEITHGQHAKLKTVRVRGVSEVTLRALAGDVPPLA